METNELLKKRFAELARRSYNSGIYTFTDFLGLSELSLFNEAKKEFFNVPYTMFGGADGTERVIVRFGSEDDIGYACDFPITILLAEPVSQKFADKLTHRDFLGALMNLGIERTTLGDIVIFDNSAYIFAKEEIAPFIISELSRVKHTDIRVNTVEKIPTGKLFKTERRTVQVSSERLDAVIAKLYSLSRDDSQSLFKKKLVFVSGSLCESQTYMPKIGDVISVRGYGRFIYASYETVSRKGKFNVSADVYI